MTSLISQETPSGLKVKVTQLCLTLCDRMDFTVHGILQARILEWVAIPSSTGCSQPRSPALKADSLPTELSGKPLGQPAALILILFHFPRLVQMAHPVVH